MNTATANMVSMQNGTKSDSFTGMNRCEQEVRLRHFHRTIDDFIAGRASSTNLPGDDVYLQD